MENKETKVTGAMVHKFIEEFYLEDAVLNCAGVVNGICFSKNVGNKYPKDYYLFYDGRFEVVDYVEVNENGDIDPVTIFDGTID